MAKFKKGDIICRSNKNQYSYSSIYSRSFVVGDVKENDNKYILQQSNFYGDMDISAADSIFIIDENPEGFILNIQKHILKFITN